MFLIASAQILEKALEDFRALLPHDSVQDLGLMIEVRILQDIEQSPAAAGFGAGRPNDDAVDPGLDDRSGAHLAGLERTVERAPFQTPVADLFAGLADAGNLRVGKGCFVRIAPIISARNDLPFKDYDCTDRYFSDCDRFFSLFEGSLHIFFVFF